MPLRGSGGAGRRWRDRVADAIDAGELLGNVAEGAEGCAGCLHGGGHCLVLAALMVGLPAAVIWAWS